MNFFLKKKNLYNVRLKLIRQIELRSLFIYLFFLRTGDVYNFFYSIPSEFKYNFLKDAKREYNDTISYFRD